MRIAIRESKDDAAAAAAREIARALREQSERWCWRCRRAARRSRSIASWWRCTSAAGRRLRARDHVQPRRVRRPRAAAIPAAIARSCASTCSRTSISPPARTHLLDGRARTGGARSARFERGDRRAGGLDLVVVGIGRNGHIGFNEPAPALAAGTHRVRLRARARGAPTPICSATTGARADARAVDGHRHDPAGAGASCCSRTGRTRRGSCARALHGAGDDACAGVAAADASECGRRARPRGRGRGCAARDSA